MQQMGAHGHDIPPNPHLEAVPADPRAIRALGQLTLDQRVDQAPSPKKLPGLYTRSGQLVLEGIKRGWMNKVRGVGSVAYVSVRDALGNAETPTTTIAPTRRGPVILPPELEYIYHNLDGRPLSESLFRAFVVPYAEDRLLDAMEEDAVPVVGLRAALVSVDQPILARVDWLGGPGHPRLELKRRVFDLPALRRIGFDQPSVEGTLHLFGDHTAYRHASERFHPHMLDWLLKYPRQAREDLTPDHPEKAAAVFPVIQAYDLRLLLPGTEYGPYLRPDVPSWDRAVYQTIILPYPHNEQGRLS